MKIFKKALAEISSWPFRIFFIIAVGITVIVIVKIANLSVSEATKIPIDLEDELILIHRFYNSEDCFAYKDEIGLVHSKIIDINKFKQETMERCFPESYVKYAFSLLLNVPQLDVLGTSYNVGPINTFNWVGGIGTKIIIEEVFVVINKKEYDGKLRINIKNVE